MNNQIFSITGKNILEISPFHNNPSGFSKKTLFQKDFRGYFGFFQYGYNFLVINTCFVFATSPERKEIIFLADCKAKEKATNSPF